VSILEKAKSLFGKSKHTEAAKPSTPAAEKPITIEGAIKLSLLQDRKDIAGLCKVLYQIKLKSELPESFDGFSAEILDDEGTVLGSAHMDHRLDDEQRWFAINTHNLENDSHTIRCRVLFNGQPQFEDSLKITISNVGELANRVSDSLKSYDSPTVISQDCNSTLFNFQDQSLTPWFDREDAKTHLENKAANNSFVKEHQQKLSEFLDNGFMVLEGWLDDDFIDKLNSDIDDAVAKKVQGYEVGSSQRIMGLHSSHKHINHLWKYPKVLEMLSHIFEDEARPCQTLTYVYGSQQSYHQDTVHLTPFPAGYMCGVWVALEDIQVGSGELRVLKGSHRLPRIYRETVDCPQVINNQWDEFAKTVDLKWQDMIADQRFEEMPYLAKKGDILIWHENLMHGGSLRENMEQSRRSIVSHYFAKGALGFYDSSGIPAILQ